jgi:hypothetical protein
MVKLLLPSVFLLACLVSMCSAYATLYDLEKAYLALQKRVDEIEKKLTVASCCTSVSNKTTELDKLFSGHSLILRKILKYLPASVLAMNFKAHSNLTNHTGAVNCLALSNTGLLISGSDDKTIKGSS